MPIDGQRRVRQMSREHEIDGATHRGEGGMIERPLREDRRVARRKQQDVARAQRHVETFGEMEHHVARRHRAAALDEAQMLLGDLGLERQLQLAQAPALAPIAEVIAHGADGSHHRCTIAQRCPRAITSGLIDERQGSAEPSCAASAPIR